VGQASRLPDLVRARLAGIIDSARGNLTGLEQLIEHCPGNHGRTPAEELESQESQYHRTEHEIDVPGFQAGECFLVHLGIAMSQNRAFPRCALAFVGGVVWN
jgi:hypothetical protein